MVHTTEPTIYQLKVVLLSISPMIWRRLLIRSDSIIADLHHILQIAMGWSDTHLHQFRIQGKRYGIARIGGIGFRDNPNSSLFEKPSQN
jgi:Plasmid pRiA4b ORF-3-like protein